MEILLNLIITIFAYMIAPFIFFLKMIKMIMRKEENLYCTIQ